ncbi:MAG: HK97 family phage prohead protease [Alphaproteobacteria bacterium]
MAGGADTLERRRGVELRAAGRRLEGYAAIFGNEARIGTFREKIVAGAFAASLGGGDILALADHDPTRLLARTRNGTLRLAEDARGLSFEIDVPETSLGRDILAMAERGDLGGMSFGFRVPRGGEAWNGDVRTLTKIDLREVSVVAAWPAYAGTTVTARSATPALNRARRYVEILRYGN